MNAYLDYAATAPLRREVSEEMLAAAELFANPDSLHAAGRKAAAALLDARDRIARVLGVSAREVYFTSGGAEADNWAIRCLGDGPLYLSPTEHAAVLSAAPVRGTPVFFGKVDGDGILTDFEHTMPEHVGLVAVMGANNEVGSLQPLSEITRATHARGGILFSDCVQAACSQDIQKILRDADAVSLSAHKLGGPKGAGVLVVKQGIPLRPLLMGGEQERGLRGGTSNLMAAVGMAKSLELAAEERERFCRHTGELRDLFEGTLSAALGEKMTVDGRCRVPNISHITFEGGETLLYALDLHGVAASGGAACSAHDPKPSHVMLAMGRSEHAARCGVRFSFGMQTTKDEVLFAAHTILSCLS